MNWLRQMLLIALRDLRSEFRTREAISSAMSFAVTILLLFSFAVDLTSDVMKNLSGGLLWLCFAFSGSLILSRSFPREQQNDCLDLLLASPLPPSALLIGKSLAVFLQVLFIEMLCFPIFGILYDMNWGRQPGQLLLVVLLATWGFAVLGSMFSALTVNLRMRELMMPMLLYPMLIPALSAAMHLTTMLVDGRPISGDDWVWVRLLIGFDVIFTTLGAALVETVLVG
jgi:heme exporter protein B